jgi:hypothetical protein
MTPSFFGYIFTLSGVIARGGMPQQRGQKHEKLESQRAIVCLFEGFNKNDPADFFSTSSKYSYQWTYSRISPRVNSKKKIIDSAMRMSLALR